jgi:hypothetical protein|tara:strand:+ start:207 stop:449 length:243 start_codon:yes stop_codon:yes gene_type:complete
MAKIDNILIKWENFKGYEGDAPTTEQEYNAKKADMFDGDAPTWTEIKTEIDNFVSIKDSAKAKLIAGEPLTEEEADTIVL